MNSINKFIRQIVFKLMIEWIVVSSHCTHHHLLSLFPTMLGSASSLTGCSRIPVFYMKRLPIWPPQPSYWATRYLLVRLVVRLPGFWLSVTTIKDLRVTAGTNGFTRVTYKISRHYNTRHNKLKSYLQKNFTQIPALISQLVIITLKMSVHTFYLPLQGKA